MMIKCYFLEKIHHKIFPHSPLHYVCGFTQYRFAIYLGGTIILFTYLLILLWKRSKWSSLSKLNFKCFLSSTSCFFWSLPRQKKNELQATERKIKTFVAIEIPLALFLLQNFSMSFVGMWIFLMKLNQSMKYESSISLADDIKKIAFVRLL